MILKTLKELKNNNFMNIKILLIIIKN